MNEQKDSSEIIINVLQVFGILGFAFTFAGLVFWFMPFFVIASVSFSLCILGAMFRDYIEAWLGL